MAAVTICSDFGAQGNMVVMDYFITLCLFLAVLGLYCCMSFSLVVVRGGCSLVVV